MQHYLLIRKNRDLKKMILFKHQIPLFQNYEAESFNPEPKGKI